MLRLSPRSTLFPYTTLFRSFGPLLEDKLCLIFKLAPSVCRMTFPILASLLVRLVVLLPFQLLRLDRKSGSAGMPRPISYAVFCLKKKSRRIFNSLSYQRILGYSPEELQVSSGFEQIHPDDREKVRNAAKEARETGAGTILEYRFRHQNGDWMVLESVASVIRNERGQPEKLLIVNRD